MDEGRETAETDDIEVLRARLESTDQAIRSRQGVVCALRDADVLSPREAELRKLIETRDGMRARLSRLLARGASNERP
jgi:hypothetical protein